MDVTLFPPGANFVRMPGFPEALRDVVPRADGQKGERDPTHYGPDWVREQRRRRILLETDLLYQFALRVAGHTGAQIGTYWHGGGDHNAAADMLITNIMSRYDAAGKPLPVEAVEQARREREKAFETLDGVAARQQLDHMAATSDRDAALRSPAVQAEMQRLVNAADRRPAPPLGKLPPAPPAQPPPSVLASSSMPEVGRPQGPQPRVQVVAPRALDAAEAAREHGPRRTVDAAGNIVYGIDDKYVMLLRIMLNSPSEAALKAWRMLYEPEGRDEPSAEAKTRYLRDLQTMHGLLHAGEGGAEWVEAPEHTGYIFFTPAFGAGVATAASDVRQLAGKTFATDYALMTHDGVRDLFARLVAHHMNAAKTRSISRYGGTATTVAMHRDEHERLMRAFRRLRTDSSGFLFVPRTVQRYDEGEMFRTGVPAPPGPSNSGREARRRMEERERDVMARTGRYLSDVY